MKRFIYGSAALFSLCALIVGIGEYPHCSSLPFKGIVAFKSAHTACNKVVPGKNGWLFLQPELDYVVNPLPQENVRLIADFSRTLAAHGITLYVTPIPTKIEIYPESLTTVAAPYPVCKCREQFLQDLRLAGVKVIDVLPALVNAKSSRPVFDPYESHWTSAGIVAAAGAIASAIDSGLIARKVSRAARYTVRDTVLQGCADLPERFKGDGKAFWYPTPVKQVLNPGGQLYADDRKSKILIFGDSFVNHGRSWSVNLGAHLAHLIGHSTRTYCSLLANTEGPSMYSRFPGLFPQNGIVVWAFASRVLQYPMCAKPGSGTRI
jgi:hypothetical protein